MRSGSVLVRRRQIHGLGLPTTEWALIQPYIDRINAAHTEGQALYAAALASGAVTEADYAAVLDESSNVAADGTVVTETLWAWPDQSITEITERADAARHLRDDPELIAFAETWAREVEASLERTRTSLGTGASSYRSRVGLATLGAGAFAVLLVMLLTAWTYRRRR